MTNVSSTLVMPPIAMGCSRSRRSSRSNEISRSSAIELLAGDVQRWDAQHPLPDEAGTDRASLGALQVRAFLLIPIAVGSSVTHLMGFNVSQPRNPWPERFVPRLRLIGEILVNAIKTQGGGRGTSITLRILTKASAATNVNELLQGITGVLHEWSGNEAVGIRLRDGDDYPYYETRGFSAEFVESENRLCARDADGRTRRDEHGESVLECLCGDVLRGRFDPQLACFTHCGSFWINSQAELQAVADQVGRANANAESLPAGRLPIRGLGPVDCCRPNLRFAAVQ